MTDQEIRDELKETEGDPQVCRAASDGAAAVDDAASRNGGAQSGRGGQQSDGTCHRDPVRSVDDARAGGARQGSRAAGSEDSPDRTGERRFRWWNAKPLAQVLYKTVDVGDVIPADQYQAVAEVLRYVYQLQGKEIPKVAAEYR